MASGILTSMKIWITGLLFQGKLRIFGKMDIILEENLKENNIRFWIDKHNRYSDLVAQEESGADDANAQANHQATFWGSPDERTAWRKQLWWKLPRYMRPMIYFTQRIIFQLGILDGRTGIIFHFLQGFWFRLIVDIKIDEIIKQQKNEKSYIKIPPLRFIFSISGSFCLFYYFNIFFFGITSPMAIIIMLF